MGAGTSRGKKVAPASGTEVKVTGTDGGPLRIVNVLRNKDRSCAQRRSAGEGNDLDCYAEEDELSTVLAEDEGMFVKKTNPKKSFIRSRTYGLCHFGQEDTGDDISSASRPGRAAGPRVSRSVSKDVNKDRTLHDDDNFLQNEVVSSSERQLGIEIPTHYCQCHEIRQTSAVEEQESHKYTLNKLTLNSCHHSSQPTVVLYDGSEEELMDTIEREFS